MKRYKITLKKNKSSALNQFVTGMIIPFDIVGLSNIKRPTRYFIKTNHDSDLNTLKNDWKSIGLDFKKSIEKNLINN